MEAKHKLIAMQEDLGLGHKGEIIITTQGRVDGNLPAVAQDVDSEYAEKICHNFNAYDSDQKKIKDLLAACAAIHRAIGEGNTITISNVCASVVIPAIDKAGGVW